MDVTEILMQEYVTRYKYILYWPLKIMGFCRYGIENDKIVPVKLNAVIYNMLLLLLSNSAVVYITYSAILTESYLTPADGICMIHFGSFSNLIIFNISVINKFSGINLISQCVKIDVFLGAKETKFMRDIAVKVWIAHVIIIVIGNISVGTYLYMVFEVPMKIHIIGSIFYLWLFFVYCDYGVYILLVIFISLRIRYLNIGLVKHGRVNEDYLPQNSLFNKLFWAKSLNKQVKIEDVSVKYYVTSLRLLFQLSTLLERYYRFPSLLGVWTIVMGTFVAVQTFILRIKHSMVLELGRTFVVVGWVLFSWGFWFILTTMNDMVQQQLNQTKLICAYIQLKPNLPADTYKLTKSIFRTLSTRDARHSIYNLFHLNVDFTFKMAAATLIYITIQLQMAFPKFPIKKIQNNDTSANISNII